MESSSLPETWLCVVDKCLPELCVVEHVGSRLGIQPHSFFVFFSLKIFLMPLPCIMWRDDVGHGKGKLKGMEAFSAGRSGVRKNEQCPKKGFEKCPLGELRFN